MRDQLINQLRWQKFPVTSDGFVTLVDVMGDDRSITQAARVSYGKDDRSGEDGDAKTIAKDRDLIRYLMRQRHTTPFEMAELKFLVRVPMDCFRQWIRHRTASVNEYSTRYTEAIDSNQTTLGSEWRLQADANKQGSKDGEVHYPSGQGSSIEYQGASGRLYDSTVWGAGQVLTQEEQALQAYSRAVYMQRLSFGVAKEQARKDLPLSTYTEAYWKIDLHNLLHFLGLRMDSHAQKEIRDYATTIGEKIVAPLFPIVWEAFKDYRLNSLTLSGPELVVMCEINDDIRQALCNARPEDTVAGAAVLGQREKAELINKLERMGVL